MNWDLRARGYRLALSPKIVVCQHRENLRLAGALRERFVWGRSYAATRAKTLGAGRRLLYIALAAALPAVLMWRMAKTTVARGRRVGPFLGALPVTAMLTASWSLGELAGYLSGRPHRAAARSSAKASAENGPGDPAQNRQKAAEDLA